LALRSHANFRIRADCRTRKSVAALTPIVTLAATAAPAR